MEKLSTVEIRKRFLDYFKNNDHLTIKASSLLPQNDPTLLFINSGMAPLKNYFLGKEEPPSKRMANFQPCIRTKDIDDVGDRHHLTLFEMMGSWSIGDYYKEDACRFAYELLVNELGFDSKRLYMTVYGGNKALGIEADTASIEAWKKCGVADDHIVILGEDNFWGPAGTTGPCGPCTEVFYDTGREFGPEYKPGGHFDDVSRYIEIWNAGVFMELDKLKDGSFNELPFKSVDTGSGLERMAMVMGGYESVYETDLLAPLMNLSRKLYGETQPSFECKKIRMISDHMRAAVMILAEGVVPSNEGQGYIPRRLIRKVIAALTARCKKIDFTDIIEKVIELQSPFYPRMEASRDFILYNINAELEEFLPVIKNGLQKINDEVKANHQDQKKLFSGKLAFELVTTFGLPLEVILSDLEDKGIELDKSSYDHNYDKHRKTSRVISRKEGPSTDTDKLASLLKDEAETVFLGHELVVCKSLAKKIIMDDGLVLKVDKAGSHFYLICDNTCFYGESGGQVGDIGTIKGNAGSAKVLDTLKINNVHILLCELLDGMIETSGKIEQFVDMENRKSIIANHSATHLLHSALHNVIGKHAVQKGSLVKASGLRFDFVHPKALTANEIGKIEKSVNEEILKNIKRDTQVMPYEDALKKGAMALFGEKYDSDVRVVSFDDNSVELCGGTHVKSTSEIGSFIIKSEGSVAKGIRRIEAVTGLEAYLLMSERNGYLKSVTNLLGVGPEGLEAKVKDILKKSKPVKKERPQVKSSDMKYIKSFENNSYENVKFFMGILDLSVAEVKALGDQIIDKGDFNIVCLLSTEGGSLKVFTWVEKTLSKTYKAGDILMKLLKPVSGKGGGRPHFAQGGAPDANMATKLFQEFKDALPHFFG